MSSKISSDFKGCLFCVKQINKKINKKTNKKINSNNQIMNIHVMGLK